MTAATVLCIVVLAVVAVQGLPVWNRIEGNNAPWPRIRFAHAFDEHSRRLAVFGGLLLDPPPDSLNFAADAWTMDVDSKQWTKLASNGPGARLDAGMVIDTARDRAVMFGGIGDGIGTPTDVWSIALAAPAEWTLEREHTPSAPVYHGPGTTPGGTRSMAFVLLQPSSLDAVLMVGGISDTIDTRSSETWTYALDGTREWTYHGKAPLQPRRRMAAALDGPRIRVLVLGGENAAREPLADMWALDLTTFAWTLLAAAAPPGAHAAVPLALDAVNNLAFLYAGGDRVHRLDLLTDSWSEWQPALLTWMPPPSSSSSSMNFHASFADNRTRTLAIWGGSIATSDLWTLDYGSLVPAATESEAEADHHQVPPAEGDDAGGGGSSKHSHGRTTTTTTEAYGIVAITLSATMVVCALFVICMLTLR